MQPITFLSLAATAGLAAAAPSLVAPRDTYPDLSKAYWDVTTKSIGRFSDLVYTSDTAAFFQHGDVKEQGQCYEEWAPDGSLAEKHCGGHMDYTLEGGDQPPFHINQKVVIGGQQLTIYGQSDFRQKCRKTETESICEASLRVMVHHYCILEPTVKGCLPADGKL